MLTETETVSEDISHTISDAVRVADESENVAEPHDRGGDSADEAQGSTVSEDCHESQSDRSLKTNRRRGWSRLFAFGVLPVLAFLLAIVAGYLKWQDSSVRDPDLARIESVQFAKDSAVAMLSYRPDTVDKDLGAARELLTGDFKNAYTSLTNDVVIPGAKQKQISAVASVPAVASVSASPNHAVALVFINQTVIVGTDAPTDTASSVKVTMDKVGGRWLISGFDPI